MDDERGFTFFELLAVLSITMIIGAICVQVMNMKMEEKQVEYFFRQLKLDIQQIQSDSIGNRRYTQIVFDNEKELYVGEIGFGQKLFTRPFPKGIKLSKFSPLMKVSFSSTGSVSQFGTLLFETPKGQKKVTIYIDRGRVMLPE